MSFLVHFWTQFKRKTGAGENNSVLSRSSCMGRRTHASNTTSIRTPLVIVVAAGSVQVEVRIILKDDSLLLVCKRVREIKLNKMTSTNIFFVEIEDNLKTVEQHYLKIIQQYTESFREIKKIIE